MLEQLLWVFGRLALRQALHRLGELARALVAVLGVLGERACDHAVAEDEHRTDRDFTGCRPERGCADQNSDRQPGVCSRVLRHWWSLGMVWFQVFSRTGLPFSVSRRR
mgnify:CR=1 FL=1